MSAREWLDSRTPPPEPLAARIRALLDGTAANGSEQPHDEFARIAEQHLAALLARGDHSRAIAADLLAIDALVTYACEAAAEQLSPDELVQWSDAFARRLALLGAGSGAGWQVAAPASRSEATNSQPRSGSQEPLPPRPRDGKAPPRPGDQRDPDAAAAPGGASAARSEAGS